MCLSALSLSGYERSKSVLLESCVRFCCFRTKFHEQWRLIVNNLQSVNCCACRSRVLLFLPMVMVVVVVLVLVIVIVVVFVVFVAVDLATSDC